MTELGTVLDVLLHDMKKLPVGKEYGHTDLNWLLRDSDYLPAFVRTMVRSYGMNIVVESARRHADREPCYFEGICKNVRGAVAS